MNVHLVQFADERVPELRALRPSRPLLRPGDEVEVRVCQRPERWRATRIAAVDANVLHLMGVTAPERTGLVCPWCGEPIGHIDETERTEADCPGCGHEWTQTPDETLQHASSRSPA